ncbi:MAG: IclR family transcriptional regulator [Chloroflexota bacterium]|nr:IclR family transcriptional regulator [Chloroflexota bacterium]
MASTYTKQDSELILSTLDKGLHVLEVLASVDSADGLSLTELSRTLGMHRTTLLRVLTTLQSRGYVSRDRVTDRFRLGMRVLSLASTVLRGLDLRQVARPTLERLCAETQELVLLTVLDYGAVVTVECLEGNQTIALRTELGARRPAYCTASGKALLAHMTDAEVDEILVTGMPPVTPRTITSADLMRHHLAEVRARGFAWDDEERLEGVRCVASAVFDLEGHARGAISIAAPSLRTSWERMGQLGVAVCEAAQEISRGLGFAEALSERAEPVPARAATSRRNRRDDQAIRTAIPAKSGVAAG